MQISEVYYFLEGFSIAFFGIMSVKNLAHRFNRLRMVFGYIMLYWMLLHINSVIFIHEFLDNDSYLNRIINTIDMTAAPTCCLLLMELCSPGWLKWKTMILNFLPFILLGGTYIYSESDTIYQILVAFFVAYGIGVSVVTLYYISRYNKFLLEHYSYKENVNLHWLHFVLFTFFVLMIVYAVCASYDTALGDLCYVTGSIIAWALIGFFIEKQESVLFELKATKDEKEFERNKEQVNDDSDSTFFLNLDLLVKERFIAPRLYLKPQLKLGDMAEAVGTNRTYLSRYLNEVLHTNFYDYVNGLRIKEAVEMMSQSEYSIQTIASIVGFNSYSTFRRTFIATYGKSPQEYRNDRMITDYNCKDKMKL